MASKVTNITLTDGQVENVFAIDVAEELLSWPRSGWMLPMGSEYEFKGGRLSMKASESETKAKKKR